MKQQKCNYFPSLWWRGREKGLSTFLFLLLFSISLHAQRQDILLNNNWNFRFSHQVQGDTPGGWTCRTPGMHKTHLPAK